jgi:hypothetical protein
MIDYYLKLNLKNKILINNNNNNNFLLLENEIDLMLHLFFQLEFQLQVFH